MIFLRTQRHLANINTSGVRRYGRPALGAHCNGPVHLLVVVINVYRCFLLPRARYINLSGDGLLFSIDFFVSLLARLRENGWTDLHEIFREGRE